MTRPRPSELIAAGLALILAACASTAPTQPNATARAPIVSAVAHAGPLIPVPEAAPAASIMSPASPTGDGATLEARLRQIDDQYARRANETRQLVQQALAGLKAAPSTSDLAAIKASIGRLETQVTQLLAAKTRSDAAVGGMTGRLSALERQLAEQAAVQAAAVPVPQAKGADPDEAGFTAALHELQGPAMATEPMRRWLELHPTHPKTPEGLFQLGLAFNKGSYPTAAAYYFKRLMADYPLSLQAKEAQALLAAIEPTKVAPASPSASRQRTVKKPLARATPVPKTPETLANIDVPSPLPSVKLPSPGPREPVNTRAQTKLRGVTDGGPADPAVRDPLEDGAHIIAPGSTTDAPAAPSATPRARSTRRAGSR